MYSYRVVLTTEEQTCCCCVILQKMYTGPCLAWQSSKLKDSIIANRLLTAKQHLISSPKYQPRKVVVYSNIFLLILNIGGRPKCTIQKTTQEIPHSAMICLNNCYSASKIIKGEVVTEISSFISRHIFAKLAEFYFHTYGFFSKNRINLISLCFENEFLMTFILKRNAIVT